MQNLEIIDTHCHVFPTREIGKLVLEGVRRRFGIGYYCTGSPEELHKVMARYGIRHAVALNQAGDSPEALSSLADGNGFICSYSRVRQEFLPAIGVDLKMRGDPVAEIEHQSKAGAKAVKLHPEVQRFRVNDRAMWPIYSKCEAAGLPIIFHCGRNILDGPANFAHPSLFRDLLEDFPSLKVVLAHMGGGFWDDATEIARAFPDNVYLDTAIAVSAIPAPDYVRLDDRRAVDMIREVGADRVMFGSDFPWVNPGPDVQRLLHLDLTDAEKRMILGQNAKQLFLVR